MESIELKPEDYLAVAKALAKQNPSVALQVKCEALVRMVEERDRVLLQLSTEYTELEEKYRSLLPQACPEQGRREEHHD